MSRSLSREASVSVVLLALSLLLAACAAPPNKEIADARMAIQAAKDAGAEQYARDAFKAASEAYRLANEAVQTGDYRLALNKALESREQAQLAAKQASDLSVRTREEAHQALVDVATLLTNTTLRMQAAERAGASRRLISDARRTLTQASSDVQKAGAAVKAEEFAKALPILKAIKGRLDKTAAALDAVAPQSSKRRS